MKNLTILGRKCDTLFLVASVALVMFIILMTVSDCNGCSGDCNKNGKSCSDGKDNGKCDKENVGGANVVGANDGTFSELADV